MNDILVWAVVVVQMLFGLGVTYFLVKLAIRAIRAPPARFRNPANNYVETVSKPFLWTFLFGPVYFAKKGLWGPAVLFIFLLPWLVFPFMAKGMIARYYLRQGWIEEKSPAP